MSNLKDHKIQIIDASVKADGIGAFLYLLSGEHKLVELF